MRRALLLIGPLVLALPAPALAGTASVRDDLDPQGHIAQRVVYAAAPGERNDLTMAARASEVELRDTAGITPGRQCSRPNPADATRVICRANRAGDFNGFASATLGDGDDRAKITEGSGTLDGGPGNDALVAGPGHPGTLMIGGQGNDEMTGGPGDDSFDEAGSHNGSDTMRGGAGADDVDYSLRSANLHVSLDNKRNDGAKGEGDLVAPDVEKVDAGSGNDTLIGNRFANVLQGATGSDVVIGGAGDDVVDAGRMDAVDAPPAHSRDRVSAGPGDDALFSAGRGTRLDGGRGHDDFIGGDGADRINARDGQTDSIACHAGRDSVAADAHDYIAAGRETGSCERIRRRGVARAVAIPGAQFLNQAGPLPVETNGVISFSVGCSADGVRVCLGSVTASLSGVRLGSHRFRARRGGADELTFTIPAGRRAKLLARPRLTLTATMVSRDRRGRRRTERDRYAVRLRPKEQ